MALGVSEVSGVAGLRIGSVDVLESGAVSCFANVRRYKSKRLSALSVFQVECLLSLVCFALLALFFGGVACLRVWWWLLSLKNATFRSRVCTACQQKAAVNVSDLGDVGRLGIERRCLFQNWAALLVLGWGGVGSWS